MTETIRIAMWSGPRNISTAMMRSFASRADCIAIDEPFYAAYLAATGLDHPMREEVLAAQPTDARAVIDRLFAPLPAGRSIHYQKHMTHHMLPDFDRAWMTTVRNAFLIRAPERVLASYSAKREDVTLADIGFVEQAAIFDTIADQFGAAPPVIDSADILANPAGMLRALCAALNIPFTTAMLAWPEGIQDYDGVWAPHWYGAVTQSTGFAAPSDAAPSPLLDHLKPIAEAARPYYERLAAHRLKPAS